MMVHVGTACHLGESWHHNTMPKFLTKFTTGPEASTVETKEQLQDGGDLCCLHMSILVYVGKFYDVVSHHIA